MATTPLQDFKREIELPDDRLDLARSALTMGQFEYPHLDVARYLHRLDALADEAVGLVGRGPNPADLARLLFVDLGFAGNTSAYHDPRNSFVNEVLDRRLGIPISLSVLFIEVARRAGVAADGIGLPGHFIVRARNHDGSYSYLDPFHRGAAMDEADCRRRVESVTGSRVSFQPSFLEPVGPRYILLRMLNNLKQIYATSRDYARAGQVIERILVLQPDNAAELRSLAAAHAGMGNRRRAIELYEQYLTRHADAKDAEQVHEFIRVLSDDIARRN